MLEEPGGASSPSSMELERLEIGNLSGVTGSAGLSFREGNIGIGWYGEVVCFGRDTGFGFGGVASLCRIGSTGAGRIVVVIAGFDNSGEITP